MAFAPRRSSGHHAWTEVTEPSEGSDVQRRCSSNGHPAQMDKVDHWWDFENQLETVYDLLRRQQVRLDVLARQHCILHDETRALRDCLEEAGAVRGELLLARQHQHCFARICMQHPCVWHESFESTVGGTREGICVLAELVGRKCIATLSAASRSLCHSVGTSSSELSTTLPPMIYVLGGENDDGQALDDVECFDPSTGVWGPSMPLSKPRKCCAATAVAGNLYVIGGLGGDGEALNIVERFNPWINKWESMPAMMQRRGALAAVSVGPTICAIGGNDGHHIHSTAEVLQLTGVCPWVMLPTMRGGPRRSAAAVQANGLVYVLGGRGVFGDALSTVEQYEAQLGLWVEMPRLNSPRAGLAAASIAGVIYIVGGCDASGFELKSLERFHRHIGVWEVLSPLAVPRWGLGAVSCVSRLYALGGSNASEVASIGACERFCPETSAGGPPQSPRTGAGKWSFVGCLRVPRRLHGAAASR